MAKTMRLLVLFLFCACQSTAEGTRRMLRVRKTGEFGRRIAPISLMYEPPRRFSNLDPFMQAAESRKSETFDTTIKKPSQNLELPSFGFLDASDSMASETGESLQGVLSTHHPDRDSHIHHTEEPYEYNQETTGDDDKSKHPLGTEYPEVDPPEQDLQHESHRLAQAPTNYRPMLETRGVQDRLSTSSRQPFEDHRASATQDQPQVSHDQGQQDACAEGDDECGLKGLKAGIPGEPGSDYPILSEVAETGFDCESMPYSGYYADTDERARCQTFHICIKGSAYRKPEKWSFLCPNGTVFSQSNFVCVWWYEAPECTPSVVSELSLRNADLGWDNVTEADENTINSNNLQASGSDSSRSNSVARPSAATNSRGHPYRVPVKVNARTQLKEVVGNGINGGSNNEPEYTGEESETFETSLSHQSSAQHRSKSSSALRQSESEAYEQKSVSDSAYGPVMMGGIGEGSVADSEANTMPSSGGYAEASDVMGEGYSYPSPSSGTVAEPGATYLPPRHEFSPRTTTEGTTTAFTPAEEQFMEEQQNGYEYQTTGEPSSSTLSSESVGTTSGQGYVYKAPTTTLSSSTATEESGYSYATQSTTQGAVVDTTTSTNGGYADETSTVVTDNSTPAGVITTTTERIAEPSGGYLPPRKEPLSRTNSEDAEVVSNSALEDETENSPASAVDATTPQVPDAGESDTVDVAAEVGDTVNENNLEGYVEKSNGPYALPTPSPSAEGPMDEENLGTVTQLYLPTLRDQLQAKQQQAGTPPSAIVSHDDEQDQVNKILEDIQHGGAEVRDENGKTLNYEELQKLIAANPSGLFSLQKAEDPEEEISDSDISPTDSPPSDSVVDGKADTSKGAKLEDVKVETIDHTPTRSYLPPQSQPQFQVAPQQSYFTNNRLVSIKRPGFEITAPQQEFESHVVQKNTVEQQQNNDNPGPLSHFPNTFQPSLPPHQTRDNFVPIQSPQSYNIPQIPQANSQSPSDFTFSRPTQDERSQFVRGQQQQSLSSLYYNQANPTPSTVQRPVLENLTSQQRQNGEYLPPGPFSNNRGVTSSANSIDYRTSQFQNQNLPSALSQGNRDITIQKSYSVPLALSDRGRDIANANSVDIKILPALLVNSHTKVELPGRHEVDRNVIGNGGNYRQFSSPSFLQPLALHTGNVPVIVRAPRLSRFTVNDALPKLETFTVSERSNYPSLQRHRLSSSLDSSSHKPLPVRRRRGKGRKRNVPPTNV